jgi:hypothetical protein
MSFLKRKDFEISIQGDHLYQLVGDDMEFVLNQSIIAGQVEMESYLRSVFDLTQIFPKIEDWTPNKAYAKDTPVWYEDELFVAAEEIVADGTNAEIPGQSIKWIFEDPRDQRLVQVLIDIVLYHIHKRVSPREIPTHRLVAYDQALYWLKSIREGQLSSSLPMVENPLTSPTIVSQPRQNWRW